MDLDPVLVAGATIAVAVHSIALGYVWGRLSKRNMPQLQPGVEVYYRTAEGKRIRMVVQNVSYQHPERQITADLQDAISLERQWRVPPRSWTPTDSAS